MSDDLTEVLRAAGADEAGATEAAGKIIERVSLFAKQAIEPKSSPPAAATKSLARFERALEETKAAFAALPPDVRDALRWEVSRPPRRGLFGGSVPRLPGERLHPGAEPLFDSLAQEASVEHEYKLTGALLGGQRVLALPRIPGASLMALAKAARALASWRYQNRRGRKDSGASDMFVDCILIWHDATGHWPPLTKGKGSDGDGGADSPVYKAIFNCLHENGAAKAQGIGDDTFLDAVRIAKSDNGVPSGLLSGRDAARAAIKDKRRNKQAKVKQRP